MSSFIIWFSNRIFKSIQDLYDKIRLLSSHHKSKKKKRFIETTVFTTEEYLATEGTTSANA